MGIVHNGLGRGRFWSSARRGGCTHTQTNTHGTENFALGSHERVGESVDARQVGGQVRGEVMAGS
jgi:hypothetical protein